MVKTSEAWVKIGCWLYEEYYKSLKIPYSAVVREVEK